MTKKNWQERKNKAAFFYYCLMIIFALIMLLIAFGLYKSDTKWLWWSM